MGSSWLLDILRRPGLAGIETLLRDDVRFRSPYADYQGRADVEHLMRLIVRVLDDLQAGAGGESGTGSRAEPDTLARTTRLTAMVDGQPVQGVLCEDLDASGKLTEVMLLLRPYRALRASLRAMERQLAESPLPSAST